MTSGPADSGHRPGGDAFGVVVLLVVAFIAGAALIAGVHFVLRWLGAGGD